MAAPVAEDASELLPAYKSQSCEHFGLKQRRKIRRLSPESRRLPYAIIVIPISCTREEMQRLAKQNQYFVFAAHLCPLREGELTYEGLQGAEIKHYDFRTEKIYRHKLKERDTGMLSGHGGADYYLFKSFVDALKDGDFSKILTGADDTLTSHLLVFAAEKARKENRVVTITSDLKIL